MSDVDDHHTALGLFARRCDRRLAFRFTVRGRGHLGSTALFLAASFLFFFEDLFDNPGIQHGGPPFVARWSSLTISSSHCVAPIPLSLQPMGLWTLDPTRSF